MSLLEPAPLHSHYGLLDLEGLMHESCRIQMHDILLGFGLCANRTRFKLHFFIESSGLYADRAGFKLHVLNEEASFGPYANRAGFKLHVLDERRRTIINRPTRMVPDSSCGSQVRLTG